MLGRVRVLMDDDGLTISNPGGFIEGVTIENLLTAEPHGRNPALADALKRIGLAERTGRGFDRIRHPELVLKFAKSNHGTVTRKDVMQLLHLNEGQAYQLLAKMANDEMLLVGKGKFAYYKVK